ncbi:uncharacterized protein LOC125658776 isoform X1 [Ostrea edulis]|uniref:uncharacterized protein LOC125658776 isoform X1 n=1 Tax=Ostrea edulis TaxID=37623 RepID=UPI0024AFC9EA|nr:uncharacterized protein LOC125658776 isoform X1 [Ostrea edulis]
MAGLDVKFVFGMLALFSQTNCKTSRRICGTPRSDRSPVCCPYFYADGDQCVECLAGYKTNKGKNCTEPCDFPSYGTHCQSTCNCSQEDCHHVNGCPVLGTTASLVTTLETTLFSVVGTISGECVSFHIFLLMMIIICVSKNVNA